MKGKQEVRGTGEEGYFKRNKINYSIDLLSKLWYGIV